MKNKMWIMIAAVFIVIMISAAVLYPNLAEKYSADSMADNTTSGAAVQAEKHSAGSTTNSTNSGAVVQADDFIVYDSEMNEVKLSDFFGKPIVINFWASWCYPCKSELPAFNSLYEEYQDDVVFLMINLTDGQRDTVDSIKKFVSDNGYSFPVYYDIEYNASNTYGVRSIPQTVLINADGSPYDTRVGAMSEVVLENYIKQMIGEEQ